jgi:PPOX class probable F420-dependent enzyme
MLQTAFRHERSDDVRLSEAEAWERLARAVIGRLATVDGDGTPHLVPAVFALQGDGLYVAVDRKPKRSTDLRRLRNIRENPRVAFLVDHYEADWSRLWWVRVDGSARVIEDGVAMRAPIELLCAKYPQYGAVLPPPEGPVIAVTIEGITGWSGER